jgi:putative CocE/NonD family hydrolase
MKLRHWLLSFSLLALAFDLTNAAESSVVIHTNVMVAMRDGVKLATDIYLPKGNTAKLPVILTRIPYNKTGAKAQGDYYAKHGYAFVAQDTRGRYASEGVWHMMTDDGRDGTDCASWIAKQEWSNGKIGMIGTSYVGGTQHAMALERTPQLTTIIPVDAVSNTGFQSMRNAGAFELRFWNWIMLNAGKGSRASRDPATAAMLGAMATNRIDYLENLPLRRGTTPLKFAPEYEDWLVEAMRHGANDTFWRQNNIIEHSHLYKDIPVYLVGGWYDSWAGNTTTNFVTLTRAIKGPVYLIMGPWIHGQQAKSAHGQVDFGKDAAIADELGWRLEWYDRWLKGLDNKIGKEAPFATKVRIFVMGTGDGHKTEKGLLFHGGSWREEREWPLARTVYTPFYLQPAGKLTTDKPTGDDWSSKSNITEEEKKQLQQTITMFEVIVTRQPQDFQSLDILKEAYKKLGQQREALDTTKRLAAAYVKTGKISQAVAEYEVVLLREPNDQGVKRALEDLARQSGIDVSKTISKAKALTRDGEVEHNVAYATATSFVFDPRNPVPTIGGNISSGDGILLAGGYDQRGGSNVWNGRDPIPLSARNDILVFQSEPLAEDTEVTGEIVVKLWASSSALDTDFTAKLIDVYPASKDFPGGFDLNLEDGIVRARFRDSLKREKLMKPGTIYPFTIKLYPTSNVFKKGHRIRVDISSSDFPRFDVNPNTGEPLNDHRRMVTAINTIYHDREHPSHIVLPVIPKK